MKNKKTHKKAARKTSIRNRILGAAQNKTARLTSIRNRILGADLNFNFLI